MTMVVWVAYFAPKHWEWYQENLTLKSNLSEVTDERDHYKNLIRPNEWGPADQHEARIVPKQRPWRDMEPPQGEVTFHFDDIKDGG